MQTKLINLITQHTAFKSADVLLCEIIAQGYTNSAYKVALKNGTKLFVKIAHNNSINKINEGDIIKLYMPDHVIYSDNTGTLICQWIEQEEKPTNFWSEQGHILLMQAINEFHQLVYDKPLEKFAYYEYEQELKSFGSKNDLYHRYLEKWCKGDYTISHNDVNYKNCMLTNHNQTRKIVLIDFEWTMLNYEWWDYINFIAEEQIDDVQTLLQLKNNIPSAQTLSDVYELLYIRWWYCYGWAIRNQNVYEHMDAYIEKCITNLHWLIQVFEQH